MKQLSLTLEGPRVAEGGVPVAALITTLEGVQDAMRLMVEHLGEQQPKRGRRPKWIQEQSALRLVSTKPGSFVAELAREPSGNVEVFQRDYGLRAFDALQNWNGSENSTLPGVVTARLYQIPSALPQGVRVWLGGADDSPRVEIKRRSRARRVGPGTEEALLHGWLKAVNWDKRTAQLHRSVDGYVRLRFDEPLDEAMLDLAKQYVEVRGRGRFRKDGVWTAVDVMQLSGTRSWHEPFDMATFLDDPNPKVFSSKNVVTASEPFDVDEFNRAIREGRDVSRGESSDW